MTDDRQPTCGRQFKTAWLLTDLHLTGLDTEECLWRPAAQGMHVHRAADGTWRADWPEHERYDLGATEHRVGDVAHRLLVVDGARAFLRRGQPHARSCDLARYRGRRA